MKPILYTVMVFCAFGLFACRKNSDNFTIQQYDADKIKAYIKANGLTAMIADTSGGDSTGIYYQIISSSTTGKPIAYSDLVSYVYTVKTFDGSYSSTDTILNHINTYAAYVTPNGLQLAIKSIAKNKGTKLRVLIPSRLAYGINGFTIQEYNAAGTVIYGTIGGNQCLDYTVSVLDDDVTRVNNVLVDKQAAYDSISIQKYMAAHGLTGQYTRTSKGVYYRVLQPGIGTDSISISSTVGLQLTGTLFNGPIFQQANSTDGTAQYTTNMYDVLPQGWLEGLSKVTAGAKLSILAPSKMAFGQQAYSNSDGTFQMTVPAFSCVRYDFNVISVQN